MHKHGIPKKNHQGWQAVTLCISTSLVLILLGLVSLSVLTGRNLSNYVKENLVIDMMLSEEMTAPEAQALCKRLQTRPYINQLNFISREQALKEGIKTMGVDPTEFVGDNPFLSSVELTLKGDYANPDSLQWIEKELAKYPKVSEINYQKDLIRDVNETLARISIALLVLAALLTFISFALINNTVRLNIYAKRFTIRTMKLVGGFVAIYSPAIPDERFLGGAHCFARGLCRDRFGRVYAVSERTEYRGGTHMARTLHHGCGDTVSRYSLDNRLCSNFRE